MSYQFVLLLLCAVSASQAERRETVNGKPCAFPFEYHGKTYRDCTSVGDTKPWCAIKTANKKYITGKWGYCAAERPTCKEYEKLNTKTNKCEPNLKNDWDGMLIKAPNNNAVYQMIGGRKHWVPNPTIYNNLYASWSCIYVTAETAKIPTGENLLHAGLFKSSTSDAVYLFIDNELRWIANPYTYNRYCFNWKKIQINNSLVGRIKKGPQIRLIGKQGELRPDLDGLLVQQEGQAAVYQILDGEKRHIPNPTVFNNLYNSWNCIHKIKTVADIKTGASLGNARLIRANGKAAVYLQVNGTKRWITSPATMTRYCYNWKKIAISTYANVQRTPTGYPIY